MPGTDLIPWLDPLTALARSAGDEILRHFRPEGIAADSKADGSPVTQADRAAEAVIERGLAAFAPAIPMVGEEAAGVGRIPDIGGGRFWLVDPLDGTKDFIEGLGEFTVNIALIEDGRPVLGVVHVPARGTVYRGVVGRGAGKLSGDGVATPIAARRAPTSGLTVVASRSHADRAALDAFLDGTPVAETRSIGSSLKLCLVAAGEADLYPRHGRTMEWDVAAGHAVVVAAGGHLTTLDGRPVTYGKPGFENPPFLAWGADPVRPGRRAA